MSLGLDGEYIPENDWSITGPQPDGTFNIPDAGLALLPADAGGGMPADYSTSVLDIFKYGVGVWSANKQHEELLDYKRWEVTQKGLYAAGQPALFAQQPNGQVSPTIWLFGGVILLAAVLLHKG